MTLHGCGKNWGLATSGGNGHHAVLEMFSLSVVWRTFHAMPSIAAWLIAALILAGGGIVARLIVDYPRLLPNSYIGFLIYRAGPTIALLWACAGAAIAINAATTRLMLLSALCGSIVAVLALAIL